MFDIPTLPEEEQLSCFVHKSSMPRGIDSSISKGDYSQIKNSRILTFNPSKKSTFSRRKSTLLKRNLKVTVVIAKAIKNNKSNDKYVLSANPSNLSGSCRNIQSIPKASQINSIEDTGSLTSIRFAQREHNCESTSTSFVVQRSNRKNDCYKVSLTVSKGYNDYGDRLINQYQVEKKI